MPRPDLGLVVTCEHGGHRIPARWAPLFRGRTRSLSSHRGWDAGALASARVLARRFGAPLVAATTSRLLIDLNRSPGNPAVFSETTRRLPPDERARLLERVHRAHWDRVRSAFETAPGSTVLHIAVHSFSPALAPAARAFDLGLLYDPARSRERDFVATWKDRLEDRTPGLRVRRNAPYRGSSDGLATAMRRERRPAAYLGIELELNQSSIASPAERTRLMNAVCDALAEALRLG